jgi:class 3 adenylate cyclase/pimeloyl-ACP methyl ester carboxylesterase
MSELPATDYARSGDLNIAYQRVGGGAPALLLIGDFGSHIEGQWEEPVLADFLRRLARIGSLITFDQRGTGVSDPVPAGTPPTLQDAMDDAVAVLDDAGVERAVLVAIGSGTPACCMLASTFPDRFERLVVVNGFARFSRAPDHPWGVPVEAREKVLAEVEAGWGKGGAAEILAPSLANDDAFRAWFARYRRLGASPRRAAEGMRVVFETDVRHVLSEIQVPTLVLHRTGDLHARVGHGRDLAARIPNATYVELPGVDHLPWIGDAGAILGEIEEFVAGERSLVDEDRILATVVFTDIVGSTEQAATLGDKRWSTLLDSHDEATRRQLARFRGREVNTTGDGFLATFDGPTRAVRCAVAIRDAARSVGVEIRVGVHTGECVVRGDDLGGLAVHIAARVGALAGPGEVFVSQTVKDLVAGSGIELTDRGTHALKGVPGEWRIYEVPD